MQIRSAIAEDTVFNDISANNSYNLTIKTCKPMLSRSQILLKVFFILQTHEKIQYKY